MSAVALDLFAHLPEIADGDLTPLDGEIIVLERGAPHIDVTLVPVTRWVTCEPGSPVLGYVETCMVPACDVPSFEWDADIDPEQFRDKNAPAVVIATLVVAFAPLVMFFQGLASLAG